MLLVERHQLRLKRDDMRAGVTWEAEEEPKAMSDEEMFEFMSGFAKRSEGLPH